MKTYIIKTEMSYHSTDYEMFRDWWNKKYPNKKIFREMFIHAKSKTFILYCLYINLDHKNKYSYKYIKKIKQIIKPFLRLFHNIKDGDEEFFFNKKTDLYYSEFMMDDEKNLDEEKKLKYERNLAYEKIFNHYMKKLSNEFNLDLKNIKKDMLDRYNESLKDDVDLITLNHMMNWLRQIIVIKFISAIIDYDQDKILKLEKRSQMDKFFWNLML
jgi:hypothetical protein